MTGFHFDDDGKATLSTKDKDVIEELRALDAEGDNVEIIKDSGGVVTAQIEDTSEIKERL